MFIDEAGHSLQPECVVPLAGLFSTETPGGGQLVLAGDPQQLGPILRSPIAIKVNKREKKTLTVLYQTQRSVSSHFQTLRRRTEKMMCSGVLFFVELRGDWK